MLIVTGRDYRANLAKYYGLAQKGEDVVVKAKYGSWKVVPISEDDVVVNKRDLPKELYNALMEVKQSMEGKKKLMTWEELVNELTLFLPTFFVVSTCSGMVTLCPTLS